MITFIDNLELVDRDQFSNLGELFVKEAGLSDQFDFDKLKASLDYPLMSGFAGLWVVEKEGICVGALGGIIAPTFFCPDKIAIEMFWYVHPDHRGGSDGIRLLEEFEKWSKHGGARYVHLAFMEGIHPTKMHDFYERRGYKKLETIYRKDLWQ